MTQDKTLALLLRIEADEKAARRATSVVRGVKDSVVDATEEILTAGGATEKLHSEFVRLARADAVAAIADDTARAIAGTKDWAEQLARAAEYLAAIGASDAEVKQVARSIEAGARATQQEYDQLPEPNTSDFDGGSGGHGGRVGRIGAIGREIRALPAIGLGGNLSTDAIGKILYTADAGLTALGATATQVGAASLIAAPAIVGVALAMSEYNRQLEAGKLALTGALDGQTRYYDALNRLTTAQAAQEIENEQQRLAQLHQQRQEVQNAIDNAFTQAQGLFGGDATARVLEATGQLPTTQLRDQLKQLDAQIASTTSYTTRLEQAQAAGLFAASDLADAEKRLAEERLSAAQGDIAILLAADQMTEQQRQDRINAINREIQIMQLVAADSSLSAEVLADLSEKIQRLERDAAILGVQVNTTADAIERENAARQLAAQIASANDAVVQARIQAELQVQQMTEGQRRQRVAEINREIEVLTRATEEAGLSTEYTDQLWMRIAALRAEMGVLQNTTETLADRMQRGAERARALKEQTDNYLSALEREGKTREDVLKAQRDLEAAQAKALEDTAKAAAEAEERRIEITEESGERREEIERESQENIAEIVKDYNEDYQGALAERDALAALEAKKRRDKELEKQKKSDDEALERLEKSEAKQLKALERSLQKQIAQLETALAREQVAKETALRQAQVDLLNAENASAAIRNTAISNRIIREYRAYEESYTNTDFWMTAIVNRFRVGLEQMYAALPGGTGARSRGGGGGARYTPMSVERVVDQRLNTYFRRSGLIPG